MGGLGRFFVKIFLFSKIYFIGININIKKNFFLKENPPKPPVKII